MLEPVKMLVHPGAGTVEPGHPFGMRRPGGAVVKAVTSHRTPNPAGTNFVIKISQVGNSGLGIFAYYIVHAAEDLPNESGWTVCGEYVPHSLLINAPVSQAPGHFSTC